MNSASTSIRIDSVTKDYRIYSTPLDRFKDALGWSCKFKEFSALSDVTFDVKAGEFWGIVGRNGSGKSTLLKIVAGQLQATKGSVTCQGRVALLQLGLGFDPELTGLENIKHSRLLQNLANDYEDIVEFVTDFSELGDFINYPVKTYSSGMYSRLAFATAIAGDPDILIADEVLAVGDMNFSQKCLAKMREFKEQGKTVVLVTHDILAVKNFCDRAIWLNDGKAVTIGPAKLVAEDFRNFMLYGVTSSLSGAESEPGQQAAEAGSGGPAVETPVAEPVAQSKWTIPNRNRRTISAGKVEIVRYRFVDATSMATLTTLEPKQPIRFEVVFAFVEDAVIQSVGVTLHDRNGLIAVHLNSGFFGGEPASGSAGDRITTRFFFDAPSMANGDYSISVGCSGATDELIEKYDYDSVVEILHPKSPVTERQGGYVIVSDGKFEIDRDV